MQEKEILGRIDSVDVFCLQPKIIPKMGARWFLSGKSFTAKPPSYYVKKL